MPITKLNSSRDFFRIWFLWKSKALLSFVIIVGLTMFYAYGATPVYESRAKVLLMPKTSDNLVITASSEQREFLRPVTDADLNTEVEVMMSDNVLYETVRSMEGEGLGLKAEDQGAFSRVAGAVSGFFGGLMSMLQLTEEPLSSFERDVSALRGSLEIEPAFESNVLLVTLRAENPERAAKVLENLLEVYVERQSAVFTVDARQDFYDDQAGTYLLRLEKAERALTDFNQQYSIVDLANQNNANIGLMTELSKELQLIEIAYDEAESRIRILGAALEADEAEALVTAEMRVIPAIVELEKAIIPLVIRRTEVAKGYTASSREYMEISGQVAALRGELKREVEKALETDKLELATLQTKKESLRRKIGQLEARATEFNQQKVAIQELERQVQIHKNHYLVYTTKTEDSRVYSEKGLRDLSNISIIDYPMVPGRPAAPKKVLLLLIGLFLGTVSAVCLPFVLETWDHKLKTVDDVEGLVDMQVVSSFPEVRN